jgi:hypothetical protein
MEERRTERARGHAAFISCYFFAGQALLIGPKSRVPHLYPRTIKGALFRRECAFPTSIRALGLEELILALLIPAFNSRVI